VKLRLPIISMIMWTMCLSGSNCSSLQVRPRCHIVGCCEVDKHSSGLLFSRKAILDVLCQQGDLVYGRPPVSKIRLLPKEQWVYDWVDTSIDESLEDFKGDTQQRSGTVTLLVPNGFSGLGIATTSALLQIFEILRWRMQELRKSQNQDLRADSAWSMNPGKMESNPGDFPGFRRLRAAARSSGLKGSEILWPSGVGIFHRSASSLLTSLVDLRFPVLCALFFTS